MVLIRSMLVAVVLYASWLAMLTMHELGHVLHAYASGGRVAQLRIPFIGFSETIVHPNPHPAFVVWGGPLWGIVLPAAICGLVKLMFGRIPQVLRFFVGFCLIANGAYVGIAWIMPSGDAADLRNLGTPIWLMLVFGLACIVSGLYCWHRTRGFAGVA